MGDNLWVPHGCTPTQLWIVPHRNLFPSGTMPHWAGSQCSFDSTGPCDEMMRGWRFVPRADLSSGSPRGGPPHCVRARGTLELLPNSCASRQAHGGEAEKMAEPMRRPLVRRGIIALCSWIGKVTSVGAMLLPCSSGKGVWVSAPGRSPQVSLVPCAPVRTWGES